MPRIRIDLPLSEDEKVGASGSYLVKVMEEFNFVPAKAQLLEYWQKGAVFEQADGRGLIRHATRPGYSLLIQPSHQVVDPLTLGRHRGAIDEGGVQVLFGIGP